MKPSSRGHTAWVSVVIVYVVLGLTAMQVGRGIDCS